MQDRNKTKTQLLSELAELRQPVTLPPFSAGPADQAGSWHGGLGARPQ